MDESGDVKLIDWNANEGKRQANESVMKSIAYYLMQLRSKVDGPLRVLSFPGAGWFWEKDLSDSYPDIQFRFVGLERDAAVYKRAERFAREWKLDMWMTASPCSFAEFAVADTGHGGPYHVIYLDWMGTWSKEKRDDLHLLFNRAMLASGGILILTVALTRGYPGTLRELIEIPKGRIKSPPVMYQHADGHSDYSKHPKVSGVPHAVAAIASDHGYHLEPLMVNVYNSKTNTSTRNQPQLQFTFQLS